ncbi:MAG TPA: hypothetical protein VMD75_08330 [Candidatus Binataceae bacterium]|nr:hypothetical protein [Candidatus Binataceae bacterium]
MSIRVQAVTGREGREEFARFPYQIYAEREAWWPPDVHNEIALLAGRSPLSSYLELAPLAAYDNDQLVARVTAVINQRYVQHWNESLGQLIHFEALPGQHEAVAAMFERALEWLRKREMKAARSGFAAFLDYPYAIDNYGNLPSFLLRGNPDYYHSYFKNAGFLTEKGQSDFTAELTPELLERYPRMVESAAAANITIKSWRRYGFMDAVDSWTDVTNASFARHWGWNPISREEVRPMMASLWDSPVADLSMMAIADGKPVGTVFSVPDLSFVLARVRSGVKLSPARGGGTRGALINIGVIERMRGRGVALAMAARSFLTMAQQGMRYAGYTLVHDDNWASRNTAAGLGARVTANFVTYRKDFQ